MIKKLLNFALLLCMLVLGAGNVWGEEVTINAVTVTSGNISINCEKAAGSSTPAVQTNGFVRLYANNTVTITSSEKKIASMIIGWSKNTSKAYAEATANCGDYTDPESDGSKIVYGKWTGSANTIVFTIGTGQKQLHTIDFTFEDDNVTEVSQAPTLTTGGVFTTTPYDVTITNNEEGATVYYTTDGNDPTTSSDNFTGANKTIQISATTIVKAMAVAEGKDNSSIASATYTFEESIANTAETAYTTAEAIALIDANSAQLATTEVFVKGTISQVDSYNATYGSITYWLDDNAFEIYGGLGLEGAKFTAKTDLVAGDEVVVKGIIKKFVKDSNTTYEMDKNNVLISRKTTSTQQAANFTIGTYKSNMTVGDDADTYTVSYDGDGTLSVKSSDEAVATVSLNGTTVTVTPIKAGTTTITISASETEKYFAAEKKYTLTVTAPAVAAELPFEFDGGRADATSDKGMIQSGLGSDYTSSPKLKFDTTGDNLVINYASSAKTLEYTIKGNAFSGGTFDVLESADGSTYTTVKTYTEFTQGLTEKCELKAESRFVKFVYTNKDAGNVALGAIKISDSVELADPELAFSKANYIFTADAADKAVTAASTKGSTGTITYALTEGDADAFQIDKTTGKITCSTVGIYTLTASIEADDNFMSKTVTATVTIETNEVTPIIEQKALVAKYGDKYYAMATDLSAVEVVVTDDNKIYAANGINENLAWTITTTGTTSTIVNGDGKYLTGNSKTSLSLGDDSFSWDIDDNKNWYTTVGTTNRTFIYNESGVFKNYASSNAGAKGYSSFASAYEVIPPIKYTRIVTEGSYGTICLPYAVSEEGHTGADFYTISGIETNGTTLTLEAVTSLEAGKPYIFQATSNVVECIYNGEVATAPIEGVYLAGTFKPITAEVGWYVMQKQNGVVGFYEVGDTTPAIGANRAYMKPLDSSIKCFTFGNTDAVQTIEALTNGNAKIYDINGRQLQQLQKGINILNGHKVMVK